MNILWVLAPVKSLIAKCLRAGNRGVPEEEGSVNFDVTQSILPNRATNPGHLGSYHLYHRAGRAICTKKGRSIMFLILAVVLVLLWLGGFFLLHVSSFLIHMLLIFAVISIIMNFVSGGRRAV
jgi:Family of unknown function (DUF5670)